MVFSCYGPPWNEGIRNMVRTLEEELRALGVEVLIYPRDQSDEDHFEHPLRQGLPTFFKKTVAYWWRLSRVAREQGVQVIHIHSNVSPLMGLKCFFIKNASRLPVLLHAAGLGDSIRGYRFLLNADRIIVGGDYLKEYLPGAIDFPPVSPHLNPEVGTGRVCPSRSGQSRKILYLGAMEPARGVLTLVDAVGELKGNFGLEDFTVTIAWNGWGNTSYMNQVKARIAALNVSQHFLWEETVEDPGTLYQRHDLVVIPRASRARMGFPLRLVEAMSYGKPVVVSDMGEMPKVAEQCGLVVKHDDSSEFAAAIYRLLVDAEFYRGCSENALQKVAQYAPDRAVARLVELYEDLIRVG